MKPTRFNPDEVAGKTPLNPNNPRQSNISNLLEILQNIEKVPQDKFHDISGTGIDEMFKGLNGNLPEGLSDNFLNALSGALGGYGEIASPERTDMLMQYLLQMLTTSDQRSWDKQVLNEQRIYDTPQNQLARLMGAGISRDAAIQLLNGSGSGSGSGSALIGSGLGASAPAVSAPSGTTEIQRSNMILGGISGIANALVNLVSQGMNMAQAYETYQFQKNQAYMSSQQVEDYNAVNSVNQQLQILSNSGVLGDKKIEDFRSTNDLTNFLFSLQDSQPAVKNLISSDAFKRATGSIYGRDYLNQVISSRRTSQDAGKLADMALRQQELSNSLQSVSIEKLSEETSNLRKNSDLIDAQTKETLQRIAESQVKIQYMNKQGRFVDIQAKQAQLNYEISETGFPIMKENRLHEIMFQAAKWRALFDPQEYMENKYLYTNKQLSNAVTAWVEQNAQNAYDLAYLQQVRNGALAGFSKDYPSLFNLTTVLQQMGILDMVKTASEDAAIIGALTIP